MSDLPYIKQTSEVKIVGQDSTGNQLNQVAADSSGNMLVKDAADGTIGAAIGTTVILTGGKNLSGNFQPILTDNSGNQTVLIKDGNGNNTTVDNGQLLTQDTLGTSSQYRAQSVTTTAAEALGAATILVNRKMLTITPTNGIIYFGTNSSVTTTTGTPIFPNNTLFLDVTDNLHIFVIAAATTDARIIEFS